MAKYKYKPPPKKKVEPVLNKEIEGEYFCHSDDHIYKVFWRQKELFMKRHGKAEVKITEERLNKMVGFKTFEKNHEENSI